MLGIPNLEKVSSRSAIQDVTIRDFSGGLRIVSTDAPLKTKYATLLDNFLLTEDLAQTVRFGTKEFADVVTTIVNATYFSSAHILVLADGTIAAVNNAGVIATIWSNAIASLLPGNPAGWGSGVTFAEFTEDGPNLIITNGLDKPVIIEPDLSVDYLQDVATGSNINVPVTTLVTVVNGFTVMPFDNKPELHISNQYSSGTWVGDAPPNNAIQYSLNGYISKGSKKIYAVKNFRNNLLVFFEETILVVALGEFNADGVHTPKVIDTINNIGAISNRSIIVTETDFFFYTSKGVASGKRNVLAGTVDAKTISEDIDQLLAKKTPVKGNDLGYSFAVQDKSKNKIFFFTRMIDTTKFILAMNHSEDYKSTSWATMSSMDFDGGYSTDTNRIFFFKGSKLYQYGNDMFVDENYYADLISSSNLEGNTIPFDWEFPWIEFSSRVRKKKASHILFDTYGTASFTLQAFVDKFYKDPLGVLTPAFELVFRGGDADGYGLPFNPYGGGRRTEDERLHRMPIEFKLLKYRISGASKEKLTISGLTTMFKQGKYIR